MLTTCVNIQRLCILPIWWLHTFHAIVAHKQQLLVSRKSSCNTATWDKQEGVSVSHRVLYNAICEKQQNSRKHYWNSHKKCGMIRKDTTHPHQWPFRRNILGPHKKKLHFLTIKEKCPKKQVTSVKSASSSVSHFRTIFLRNSFETAQSAIFVQFSSEIHSRQLSQPFSYNFPPKFVRDSSVSHFRTIFLRNSFETAQSAIFVQFSSEIRSRQLDGTAVSSCFVHWSFKAQ
jgi:hypothetical protein